MVNLYRILYYQRARENWRVNTFNYLVFTEVFDAFGLGALTEIRTSSTNQFSDSIITTRIFSGNNTMIVQLQQEVIVSSPTRKKTNTVSNNQLYNGTFRITQGQGIIIILLNQTYFILVHPPCPLQYCDCTLSLSNYFFKERRCLIVNI